VPEAQFGVIIFCLVSALAFSAGTLWSLKKAGAARRKKIHPPAGFMVGALIFGFVYGVNRLAFPAFPKAAPLLNLALLACILLFPELKKKLRRPRPKYVHKNYHLGVEAMALQRMLEIDPLNAYCFERLSEIYEKMGKPDRALHAAREAYKLEPTVKNGSRVEELARGR
jgi:hypothetical protein